MNNTLTAKEWLEKECQTGYWDAIEIAEKYANYKNRILEDRIKEFRKEIKDIGVTIDGCQIIKKEQGICYNIQNAYDKHFNIENKQ